MTGELDHNNHGHRERLRQQFLSSGGGIGDAKVLELLLTYAIPRRDVSPIATALLHRFGTLSGVLSAHPEELHQVEGIGESVAVLIKLVQYFRSVEQPMVISSGDSQQLPLFSISNEKVAEEQSVKTYANDEIANALNYIPQAIDFQSLEDFRTFLNEELPYNAASTRHRRASYLLDRFYPEGRIDTDLTEFLKSCKSLDCLKPILFYHVLKTEPLVARVAEEFIWPALPVGYIEREALRSFVLSYLPKIGASSQKNILRSILSTYDLLGMGDLENSTLRFGLHTGTLESFLYILTAEFSEPGTYTFQQLDQSVLHHWLLWHRDWMRQQLYLLRDIGIISKISEIDAVRQFTVSTEPRNALKMYFSQLK